MSAPYIFYSDEHTTLWCGRAEEVLPTLGPVDLVLTDFPYGIGEQYASFDDTGDSLQRLIDVLMPLILKAAPVALISTGTKNIWRYPPATWVLCWFNPAGGYPGPWGFTCWHPVLAYGPDPFLKYRKGSQPDAIKRTGIAEKNGHPCPKPTDVWRWLILRGLGGQAGTVLDPMVGSGTTLECAKRLGLRAIGIEIEEKYCEIAVSRLAQQTIPFDLPSPDRVEAPGDLFECLGKGE